ncbi:YbbR-like domain-containing protein [Pedobacter sp. JCM 36344]|uniref:CdaR family protein n=1 Tax=Pedobacter sp. JCM 36344 TaxID=3374280 RepID=UPI00397B1AF5
MPLIRLTKIERKRFLVLIACLLLAIGAWLFMALNKKYVYTSKTVLYYKNFPQKKAFHPLQSDTVDLQVEGTGWQLLFARLRVKPQSISINLEKLNTRNYVLFAEQLVNVNRQLETSQKIISVNPDTLYFDFTLRTVKRVPVKLMSNISFVKQYGISDDIEIIPEYITLSGPQDKLEKINVWPTDTLTLKNVQATSVTRVSVAQNKMKNVNIFPSSAEVTIPVDEFTEKTMEIPVKIINNKDYYNIKLYPKKVKVTFLIALSKYQQTNETYIDAVVDLDEWKILNHNKLRVSLSRFPDFCKLVSIVPDKLDFIIEK